MALCNAASSLAPAPGPADWPKKGDPLRPGQYVIHTGAEVHLPYLPDPLADGVALLDPAPASDGWPIYARRAFPARPLSWSRELSDWPDRRSMQIVLRTSAVAAMPRDAGGDERSIEIELPPGRTLTLRYSSLPAAQLDHLALWSALSAAERAPIADDVAEGRHWMFTPWRELTLVHAVQRPVAPPELGKYELARDRGDLGVRFSDIPFAPNGLFSHSWSTSHVDVRATWDDWIDDPRDPGGLRLERRSADAFRVAITAGQDSAPLESRAQAVARERVDGVLPWAAPSEVQPPPTRQPAVHQIGDTRHHMITYTPVGTTRYQEYFPADVIADHRNLELAGPSRLEPIPSSATPPPPAVLYAVPTFRWETIDGGRKRVGGGLRIYLDRPWFQTGEGERLAVIVPGVTADGTPLPLEQVSAWGVDPTWAGAAPPPLADAIQVPTDSVTYFAGTDHAHTAPRAFASVASLPDRPEIYSVIGYQPEWNAERGLWYVDVELDTGTAYVPFVSLALARWQPRSLDQMSLSNVVRCHFAQLAPDRIATVHRSGSLVSVEVRGISAGNALEAIGASPGPIKKRPRDPLVHAGTWAAAHRVFARLELLAAGLDPAAAANELRWAQIGSQVELAAVASAPPEVTWRGNLRTTLGEGSWRVVITESEVYASDTGTLVWVGDGYQWGRTRVVYLDTLPLG
jgi:hypothetical protein